MGKLTTHVLDTANGCPAAGMQVTLLRVHDARSEVRKQLLLNHDGRADAPLLEGTSLERGRYRLLFAVGAYFRQRRTPLPEVAFLDEVPLDFGVDDPSLHYHVPLLVSPWSYGTYRGS